MILVHGFTQTADSWEPVLDALPPSVDALAVEVPEALDFDTTAAVIGARGGPATYVGYSMGGRLSLALALDRPDIVHSLVLVSASPGIADERERANRRAADDQLAHDVERDGLDAFLERWLAQPLFASLPRELAGVDQRRRGNSVERITHQLRALGQGAQPSLWHRLPELRMPVLLVTGAYDRKFRDLASTMAAAIGDNARAVTVPEAGHALHLEQPAALAALLAEV
ncbi:MAG: alpha/beta fold hydrolase [Acidimicrobiia bacterium]|jgi:2-succinyl-6-hydroxy-2,4-cyclohexadiene-1-carboxylate synthase